MNEIINRNQTLATYRSEELIRDFLEYSDVKKTSEESYIKNLRPLFRYLAQNGITQPTRADIKAYREMLLETKKETTVSAYMTTCRLFFKWTEKAGLYPNIADRIKGAKVNADFKKDNLTASQVKEILQSIDQDTETGRRDYAMFLLMVVSGMRTCEVITANIEDLTVRGNRTCINVKGKGRDGKDEYINIPAEVEQVIRKYLQGRDNTEPDAPMFTSTSNSNRGQRLTTRSIRRIIKNRMKSVGLDSERLTAHSTRHTAITLALLQGESIEEAQVFARHRDVSTTMRYAHIIDKANNNCSSAIASAIL